MRVAYAFSREAGESDLLSGRLDDARLRAVLAEFAPGGTADEWYLCGPAGLVLAARQVLGELGADPAHVHHEVFYEPPAPDPTGS